MTVTNVITKMRPSHQYAPQKRRIKNWERRDPLWLPLQDGKIFPSMENRTEEKSCRTRQSNKGEDIIFGEAARWIIVGHKTSEICRSQSLIQEGVSWAGGHQGFLVMRGI